MSGLRTVSESLVIELRCDVCILVVPELDTRPNSRPISITLRRISGVRLQLHIIIKYKLKLTDHWSRSQLLWRVRSAQVCQS